MSSPSVTIALGQHHSGTSCLAGCLVNAGLDFGGPLRATYERNDVINLHARMMRWDNPVIAAVTDTHRAARDAIATNFSGERWGFKDPMALFTLDLWREAFDVRLVGTFRDPLLVISHQVVAHGMDRHFAKWEALWLRYNERLLELHDAAPFPLVSFDLDPDDYGARVRSVLESLGFTIPSAPVFDLTRRQGAALEGITLSNRTRALFAELKDRGTWSATARSRPH